MKRQLFLIAFCLVLVSAAVMSLGTAVSSSQEPREPQAPRRDLPHDLEAGETAGFPGIRSPQGKMVIANRASGTISVIDVASDRVIGTYALPAGSKTPEPMYVVYSRDRVFVGDRANNRVAVFNPRTFVVETTVPAGAGVWHMWADPFNLQLWVSNDIDKTCTVIDPGALQIRATAPIPADLVSAGAALTTSFSTRPQGSSLT